MRVLQPLRTVLPGNLHSGEGYLERDLAGLLSRGRVKPLSSGGSSSPNQGERGPPVIIILVENVSESM